MGFYCKTCRVNNISWRYERIAGNVDGYSGLMRLSNHYHNAHFWSVDLSQKFLQRWNVVQQELITYPGHEIVQLMSRVERLIHISEWRWILEGRILRGVGRPSVEYAWLANAFLAKAVSNLVTTVGLIKSTCLCRGSGRVQFFQSCLNAFICDFLQARIEKTSGGIFLFCTALMFLY